MENSGRGFFFLYFSCCFRSFVSVIYHIHIFTTLRHLGFFSLYSSLSHSSCRLFFLSLLLIFVSYRTMLILWFLLSSFVLLVVLFQILFDFISTRRFFFFSVLFFLKLFFTAVTASLVDVVVFLRCCCCNGSKYYCFSIGTFAVWSVVSVVFGQFFVSVYFRYSNWSYAIAVKVWRFVCCESKCLNCAQGNDLHNNFTNFTYIQKNHKLPTISNMIYMTFDGTKIGLAYDHFLVGIFHFFIIF